MNLGKKERTRISQACIGASINLKDYKARTNIVKYE